MSGWSPAGLQLCKDGRHVSHVFRIRRTKQTIESTKDKREATDSLKTLREEFNKIIRDDPQLKTLNEQKNRMELANKPLNPIIAKIKERTDAMLKAFKKTIWNEYSSTVGILFQPDTKNRAGDLRMRLGYFSRRPSHSTSSNGRHTVQSMNLKNYLWMTRKYLMKIFDYYS